MNNTQENEIQIPDTWIDLQKQQTPKTSHVIVSELAKDLVRNFDYETDGKTEFLPYKIPELPTIFKIGVIVGASGSGKSTLLAEFGESKNYQWDNRALCDHFENAKEAQEKLFAVGLTSVPTWIKPYQVLSNGEKFRADLAIKLENNAVIDEYTSVVDRNIAKAASKSLQNYVSQKGLTGIVIATCHRDIIEYLQPDWIIDTDAGAYVVEPKECLRRKPLVAEVYEVKPAMWDIFSKHHYLRADLSPFARCYAAIIEGQAACFYAVISYPSGTVKHAFRGHRLVTQPDFQGLGIGVRLSDYVANGYFLAGKRFFAKTAHSRLGEYRERSIEWKPTSKNRRYRTDAVSVNKREQRQQRFIDWKINPNRLTFSHEFIGKGD